MTVPLQDAATVMLVRDAAAGGLEVFMLQRRLQSDFVGGAFVFPGGGVDPHDRHLDLEEVCAGRSDAEASRRLDVAAGGLAFWVAAIRESFEEAGVLLAYDRDGEVVSFADPDVAARFDAHRDAVDRGGRPLVDVCREEGLRLAVDRMYYFSHWITPLGAPRRYDTRFFLAAAPPEQVPLHDGRETITHTWVRPAEAIAAHEAGEFPMIFPTVRSLEALRRFDCAADALAAAAALDHVPAILPRIVADDGGGIRIVLPGDPDYEVAVSGAWPEGGIPVDTPLRTQEPA